MFTYTYNAAGRLVRAQSITATVAYTYTADGLRVGQETGGAVATYAWDWAAAVPELLQTCNLQSAIYNLYLIGHETLVQPGKSLGDFAPLRACFVTIQPTLVEDPKGLC